MSVRDGVTVGVKEGVRVGVKVAVCEGVIVRVGEAEAVTEGVKVCEAVAVEEEVCEGKVVGSGLSVNTASSPLAPPVFGISTPCSVRSGCKDRQMSFGTLKAPMAIARRIVQIK
jgi:hypothetical protein